MKRLSLILSLLFAVSFTCAAQLNNDSTVTISGQVVDENDEPLINAAVYLLNSSNNHIQKTVTDFDGNYVLDSINRDNVYKLEVRYSGMKKSIETGISPIENEVINFKMQQTRNNNVDEYVYKRYTIRMINTYDYSPINKTFTSEEIERLAH